MDITHIQPADYRYDGSKSFAGAGKNTSVTPFYEGKKSYKEQLETLNDAIDESQRRMYADDRYAMLAIFQAMDAAGKDGTIRQVFSGVNPHGLQVSAFKKPSDNELDHDYMWRCVKRMPQRGRIGIFNRSYYEEVLVVRVHPVIMTDYQRIPSEHTSDVDAVWEQRFEDIANFEKFQVRNGTHIVKFFLNLSRDEQRSRFIGRIDEAEKNWKFSEGDVKERKYWDKYMASYEDIVNKTATPDAPWYVIPADDKKNMRLIVASCMLHEMERMKTSYPEVSDERREELKGFRDALLND
ncbi:MAG: polyphosphate kinase 2 family protein [Bacteroidia bacterium]